MTAKKAQLEPTMGQFMAVLEDMNGKFESQLEDMNGKFDLLAEGQKVLHSELQGVRTELKGLDAKVNKLDAKVDNIYVELKDDIAKLDERFNKLDYKFDVLDGKIDKVQDSVMDGFEVSMNYLSTDLENVRDEIGELRVVDSENTKRCKKLGVRVTVLESKLLKVQIAH